MLYSQVLYEVNKIQNVKKIIDYFNLKCLIVFLWALGTQLCGSKLRLMKKMNHYCHVVVVLSAFNVHAQIDVQIMIIN